MSGANSWCSVRTHVNVSIWGEWTAQIELARPDLALHRPWAELFARIASLICHSGDQPVKEAAKKECRLVCLVARGMCTVQLAWLVPIALHVLIHGWAVPKCKDAHSPLRRATYGKLQPAYSQQRQTIRHNIVVLDRPPVLQAALSLFSLYEA